MIGRHVASEARLNTIIALVLSPTATLSALIWAPAHVPGPMLNLRCESPPALGPASTTRGTLYLFRLRPTGAAPLACYQNAKSGTSAEAHSTALHGRVDLAPKSASR